MQLYWNALQNCYTVYDGKTDDAERPPGAQVVLDLLSICEYPRRHHVYMDNFFSSYVSIKLKQLNFRATGTVRENKFNRCTITNTKAMKNKERDSFGYQSERNLKVVCWHGNSIVTLLRRFKTKVKLV